MKTAILTAMKYLGLAILMVVCPLQAVVLMAADVWGDEDE